MVLIDEVSGPAKTLLTDNYEGPTVVEREQVKFSIYYLLRRAYGINHAYHSHTYHRSHWTYFPLFVSATLRLQRFRAP